MNILEPLFFAALGVAAIPIVLHMISRWQIMRVDLGTMRFLVEVLNEQAKRRRVRRWLLLMLRVGIVGLLALLFARPSIPKPVQRDGDRMRIVMIDQSASMAMRSGNGERLIDAALSRAREITAELGPDARTEAAFFDSSVHPIRSDSVATVSPPETLSAGTNYGEALRWARDRSAAFPESRVDVFLITDLQRSGLAGNVEVGMPEDVPVTLVDVGRDVADNLAVLSVRLPTGIRPPKMPLKVESTIFNFGPADHDDVPVVVSARKGSLVQRIRQTASIPFHQAVDVSVELNPLESGLWEVTVDVDVGDDLAADDRRRTAVLVADDVDVLVLDGGTKESDESFYLRVALDARRDVEQNGEEHSVDDKTSDAPLANGRTRFRPHVTYLDDGESIPSLTGTPLVVAADFGQLPLADLDRLTDYVRGGGRLLVFSGSRMAKGGIEGIEEAGLAPGILSEPRKAGTVPYRFTSWNRAHPMLEPFADPQHGDLARLAFDTAFAVKPSSSTVVLASFEPNLPAIMEYRLGEGRVVWCSIPVTRQWGSWTVSPLFLPIVQQMATDLLGLTGEGPIRQRNSGGGMSIDKGNKNSAVDDKLDSRVPGFYLEPDAGATVVVNIPSDESDTTRIQSTEFYEGYSLPIPLKLTSDQVAMIENKQTDATGHNELWHWVAISLLGLLVVEFAVAGRTPG